MSHNSPINSEVIIVGGGPIGIELAIALQRAEVDYILLEARQIGQAFLKWPAHTQFFSTPEHVALAGVPVHTIDQQSLTGDEYLAYLRMLVEMFDLKLRNYEPVTSVEKIGSDFKVLTLKKGKQREYRASYVVLASGGMAEPRLLNIPGEDLPHVSHYFSGAHPYFRTKVLVVGGKNSALESALRCWRAGAERVAISYRRAEFDFDVVKPHLGADIRDRIENGEIDFYPSTVPVEITPTSVYLKSTARDEPDLEWSQEVEADFVLLNTGFVADSSLFKLAGVALKGAERAPLYDQETMETNVPGLFVAGTSAAGSQIKFEFFISTTHDHVGKIVRAITGILPQKLGTAEARNSAVTLEEVRAN